MTLDVSKAIEPKSDQLNADDLLTGPQTVKIVRVEIKPTSEQPVWIHLEGKNGKPWKPSKTALRCLAMIWGADASKWSGLRLTLYNDPDVQFGGVRVGGIRVSNMEGLTEPRTLMLTKSRAKKGATVIKPLDVEQHKPTTREPIIDREEMQRQADAAKEMSPEEKREWWGKLNDAEKAVVRELTAKKDAGDE